MEVQEPEVVEPNVGWTEALGEHAGNPPTPRRSGDTVFGLGREWRMASMENRIKAQFEQWVRSNAKRRIAAAEAEDGPDEGQRQRDDYYTALDAGAYNWDGRACRAARQDVPGIVHLIYLLIRRCHEDFTPEQARALFQENGRGCGEAMRWAFGNPTGAPAADANGGTRTAPAPVTREEVEAEATRRPALRRKTMD